VVHNCVYSFRDRTLRHTIRVSGQYISSKDSRLEDIISASPKLGSQEQDATCADIIALSNIVCEDTRYTILTITTISSSRFEGRMECITPS